MKRANLPIKKLPSRYLGRAMVSLFVLTIAAFLLGRVVAERRAHGIDAAASSIATVAAPAIEHLSKARTELRHMDAVLTELVSGSAAGEDVRDAQSELKASREEFGREWEAYLALAPYAGEPDVWAAASEERRRMDQSIDIVVSDVRQGNTRDAAAERALETAPSFDKMDAELLQAVDINADAAARLGNQIELLRGNARTWGVVLDGLSVIFAGSALFLLLRMVRRFTEFMDLRVSELEMFAGRVAHDIRSPLTAVSLALDWAKRSPELQPQMGKMLDRGIRSLQRVGQVVDALLIFARAGGERTENAQADVEEVITDIVEGLRATAEEKGIELCVVRCEPLSKVACSPGVLVSLVSNLVGNAIKYMGDAPTRRVTIRASMLNEMVRVEVRDTGPGVPPELRERIFDPYVRAAQSNIAGMGLGLATVRRLTESHSGVVGVEANAGTGGSVFWFKLPMAVTAERSPGPESWRREREPSRAGLLSGRLRRRRSAGS